MRDDEAIKSINEITQWYDSAANRYRVSYLSVKIFQLLVTASIPIVSLAMRSGPGQYQGLITGTLAAILLVAEGIQQMLQLLPR